MRSGRRAFRGLARGVRAVSLILVGSACLGAGPAAAVTLTLEPGACTGGAPPRSRDLEACAGESVPPRIDRLSAQAGAMLARAAGMDDPAAARRLARRARRLLRRATRTAARAVRAGRLGEACGGALRALLRDVEALPGCFVREVAPVADTYVEAGTEATWDHGGAQHLDVDANPLGVTYLKFDLSAVAQPVVRAELELHVTNASSDGGGVYRILDTGWREGRGNGVDASSAGGPGLKWTDVDGNRDGRLDARDVSPLVPEPARMVGRLGPVSHDAACRVDVTAAFQDGPGLYTLAVMSGRSDGTTFRSREYPGADQRPVLRLTRGGGPPTPPPPPPPPPPPASFACLAEAGPVIALAGQYTSRYSNRALLAGTKIDARAATFVGSAANLYPIVLEGDGGACIAGGTVLGRHDRSLTWEQMHDMNHAGLHFENDRFTVDGVRIDNVEDGIRPVGRQFTIRQAWLSYIRDDCVENDHVQGGLIDDSLFDGCYVGIAARPTSNIIREGYDGRDEVLTIRNTLIRLAPMPGPRGGGATDLGHGNLFKWHDLSTQLALHDNVFMVEQMGQGGASSLVFPSRIASCSNNVMVWLGPGDYPAPLPACVRVTRDRAVWDEAVAVWKLRHPHVGAP